MARTFYDARVASIEFSSVGLHLGVPDRKARALLGDWRQILCPHKQKIGGEDGADAGDDGADEGG